MCAESVPILLCRVFWDTLLHTLAYHIESVILNETICLIVTDLPQAHRVKPHKYWIWTITSGSKNYKATGLMLINIQRFVIFMQGFVFHAECSILELQPFVRTVELCCLWGSCSYSFSQSSNEYHFLNIVWNIPNK